MALVTLDVVLFLPLSLRRLAIDYSNRLADLMEADGGAGFRLGEDFPGLDDGPCEPHISMFMMAVEEDEVPAVFAAVAEAAATVDPVVATAEEYRFNADGAPEVFFARSDGFRAVQAAVVSAAEPLRRGRLRQYGPGGEPLAEILDDPSPKDPARVRQLERYGFDDVSDEIDDRHLHRDVEADVRDRHRRAADHRGVVLGPQPSGFRMLLRNRPLLLLAAVVGLWQLANGAMFLASNPGEVIAVQALDGIGAGLQGALFAIMVADLTRGSGRFNVAFGAATMVQGVGGALSPALAGAIDQAAGHTVAMLALTAIAAVALVLLIVSVPETRAPDVEPASTRAG